MTEHSDEKGTEAPVAPEETGEGSANQPPEDTPEAPPGKAPGRGLAVLALMLGLLAAAAAGWSAWHVWQLKEIRSGAGDRAGELASRIDGLATRVGEIESAAREAARSAQAARDDASAASSATERLAGRLDRLAGKSDELSAEIAALQESSANQADRIERVASRLDGTQGDSPGRDLAIVQAEYLVSTAYRLLELEGDPERAARALALAAERLEGVSAPGLTRVRELIARELEAVRAMPRVQSERLAARLAALADRAGSLPLRGDSGPAAFAAGPGTAAAEEEAGWWGATRSFLGEYFTVRRTDQAGAALPDPDALRMTRSILRLELEQARLALVRGDAGRYRSSLDRARELLENRFAPDNQAVRSTLEGIAELRAAEIEPPLPEHGEALEALVALRGSEAGGG